MEAKLLEDRIKSLIEAGYTAGMIEKAIDYAKSRSAIIGIASRRGWFFRSRFARTSPEAERLKSKAALVGIPVSAMRSQAAADAVIELADDRCRWPVGDPYLKGFHFCPASRFPGSSYCSHHLSKSKYQPASQGDNHNGQKSKPEEASRPSQRTEPVRAVLQD